MRSVNRELLRLNHNQGWTLRSNCAGLRTPLNGEMSEWLKQHAWKALPAATTVSFDVRR